ncbi:nucleotide excision repair protein RAD23 [Trichophyton equinum CBS 127.97]|uniref:UV excision repair protein RAD23 n=1 Tax=Trichophyton equinum (strain ATCC MYA-4606 / CBS 127.97) TaxID=559882 RepID=F2PRR5_TRIEC|nr:nucleotide excision repair protein RAD23 [Trichophyton equinum CBS 127.97]
MKLTFRDLKQQKFVIDAEPSDKILDVKEKIATEKGWPASQQKLIYSGKILQDDNTVESYNIEEKGFIVCMVSKPKAAPSASAASSSQTPAAAPSAPAPVTPSAPSRANAAASETPATPSPAGGAGETAGSLGSLEFLRNNPHFQQLRQLVQQQPQMLEPILQQVGAGNPQLAQLIGQNQEQFLQLLSEDVDDETQLPPGTQSISVTEEERDAIERLCRLGFSRDSVIQAYFACDKNEELAANFLFDQPDENEDQQ